jgi:hypothetical protein
VTSWYVPPAVYVHQGELTNGSGVLSSLEGVLESLEDVIVVMQSAGVLEDERGDLRDEFGGLLWHITHDMIEQFMLGFMESVIPLTPVTAARRPGRH